MKNLDYSIYYASATFSGYGHYNVEVELQSEATGDYKKFRATTTDMRSIDAYKDAEEREERNQILFDCIENQIDDEIIEWLYLEQDTLQNPSFEFENIAVTTKDKGDCTTLGFVSGNSVSEIKETVKADKNYRFRNHGIITICFDDRLSINMNSNKF